MSRELHQVSSPISTEIVQCPPTSARFRSALDVSLSLPDWCNVVASAMRLYQLRSQEKEVRRSRRRGKSSPSEAERGDWRAGRILGALEAHVHRKCALASMATRQCDPLSRSKYNFGALGHLSAVAQKTGPELTPLQARTLRDVLYNCERGSSSPSAKSEDLPSARAHLAPSPRTCRAHAPRAYENCRCGPSQVSLLFLSPQHLDCSLWQKNRGSISSPSDS